MLRRSDHRDLRMIGYRLASVEMPVIFRGKGSRAGAIVTGSAATMREDELRCHC
jgi:hypothetical protein